MNSRRSQLIRFFLRAQKVAQRHATIDGVRRLSNWSERLYPIPRDVRHELTKKDGRRCEWLIPRNVGSEAVIFYIHGGGFVLPLYNPSRYVAGYLGRLAELRVLLADYRVAPEHPFPAAVEDCVEAYRWLISTGCVLPEQVIFVGESAGGNLVITTMLSLRDAGDPLPGGAVAICPVFDFEGHGSFYEQDDPMVAADFIMLQLNAYRGDTDARDPRLSPLYANLGGLPPLMIQIGALEMLRSGAETLASRAEQAGVLTRLETWPGMWHFWHLFVPFLPEAQQAIESINQFVLACIKPEPVAGRPLVGAERVSRP
jgi:monoterpene epsilon-lactone hydrolase